MSSGFVTETEAAEARKRRQEEWEKVRNADEPLERPEEPYDGRSLYDRLRDQKMKSDLEYEESHKLKNLIRGLDDDEVKFLDMVDNSKIAAERKQLQDDERELKEFRNSVANLHAENLEKKLKTEFQIPKVNKTITTTASARPTQKQLLGHGIKRKFGEVNSSVVNKMEKTDENNDNNAASSSQKSNETKVENAEKMEDEQNGEPTSSITNIQKDAAAATATATIKSKNLDKGALKCIAILPGIGSYTESSDSECSSGSDEEPIDANSHYDLVGRKRQKKKDE